MMVNTGLGTSLYFMLFFFGMLIPINTNAESIVLPKNVSTQNLKTENSNSNIFIETEAFPEDASISDDLEDKQPFFSFLDIPQEVISLGVEAFAKNLDEFFSNDKVFYDTSGSYLRLRTDAIWNEKGDVQYTGDIRFKLRLPHSKNKLKFIFVSDADEREDEISVQKIKPPVKAAEDNDYFTGIQAVLGKKEAWQFKPSIGIRLSSSVEPYLKLRFKRKYEFEKWSAYWHETPYWFDSLGWGFDSYLELNRKISEDDLFRAATFARWTRETNYFELSQTFSMFHTLSKRRAISYYVGVYGRSDPTISATHYLIGSTYRQNIHKDYLFIELIPQIKYQKINDFHAEHSIIFRLEMVFKK